MLLNYLCPKATIKSSTTLAKYKLPMLYKNIEKHVQEQLDEDIPNSKIVAYGASKHEECHYTIKTC